MWTGGDLNPWPHACKACDLPADLPARIELRYHIRDGRYSGGFLPPRISTGPIPSMFQCRGGRVSGNLFATESTGPYGIDVSFKGREMKWQLVCHAYLPARI